MKDLLSQLFGFRVSIMFSEKESVSEKNIKSIHKINKNINPITKVEIIPLGIKKEIQGYEYRQDNIEFIFKEFKNSNNN
jgi:hypothetical protein